MSNSSKIPGLDEILDSFEAGNEPGEASINALATWLETPAMPGDFERAPADLGGRL